MSMGPLPTLYYTGVSTITGTGWASDDNGIVAQAPAPGTSTLSGTVVNAVFGSGLPGLTAGTVGADFTTGTYGMIFTSGPWTLVGSHTTSVILDSTAAPGDLTIAGNETTSFFEVGAQTIVTGTVTTTDVLPQSGATSGMVKLSGSGKLIDTGSFDPSVTVAFTGAGQELDLGLFGNAAVPGSIDGFGVGDTIDLLSSPSSYVSLNFTPSGAATLDYYNGTQYVQWGQPLSFTNTNLGDLQVQSDGHGGTDLVLNNNYEYLLYEGVSAADPSGWATYRNGATLPLNTSAPTSTDSVVFGSTNFPAGLAVVTSGTVGTDFGDIGYISFASGGAWTLAGNHTAYGLDDSAAGVVDLTGVVNASYVSLGASADLTISGTLNAQSLSLNYQSPNALLALSGNGLLSVTGSFDPNIAIAFTGAGQELSLGLLGTSWQNHLSPTLINGFAIGDTIDLPNYTNATIQFTNGFGAILDNSGANVGAPIDFTNTDTSQITTQADGHGGTAIIAVAAPPPPPPPPPTPAVETLTGGNYTGTVADQIVALSGNNYYISNTGSVSVNGIGGNLTLYGGAGNDIVTGGGLGQLEFVGGSASSTVSGPTIGADTIFATSAVSYVGAGGSSLFIGNTDTSTVVSAAHETTFGGSAGQIVEIQSNSITLAITNGGASTVSGGNVAPIIWGNSNSQTTVASVASGANVVAFGDNDSINGASAGGGTGYIAWDGPNATGGSFTGNTTLTASTAGNDTVGLFNGGVVADHTIIIENWQPSDTLFLAGYTNAADEAAVNTALTSGGSNVSFVLSDHAKVTFVGSHPLSGFFA